MNRIPTHIGIIPDGNRRWAKENGHKKEEGYAFGLEPGVKAGDVLKTFRLWYNIVLWFEGFFMDIR